MVQPLVARSLGSYLYQTARRVGVVALAAAPMTSEVARSPKGQAAAQRVEVEPVPLTSEEARQQAQAEGLTLIVAENKVGYFGVSFAVLRGVYFEVRRGKAKPYEAAVRRGGKQVYLGRFATRTTPPVQSVRPVASRELGT